MKSVKLHGEAGSANADEVTKEFRSSANLKDCDGGCMRNMDKTDLFRHLWKRSSTFRVEAMKEKDFFAAS